MKLLKTTIAATLVILMAACGQKVPSPEEVATRINMNQELSEADYASMIDYCGDYAKSAQKYYDIINAEPNDSTAEAIRATNDLASLYESYPYQKIFSQKLMQTDMSQLGAENEKKVNEYARYQAFPLPQGAGADLENPDVVGMIEQMPDTQVTDSTGVISTGAGEAVDVTVK